MTLDRIELWTVILVLWAGTCLIRLSFLGLLGNRPLPDGLLRHLRYTAVAVMPGLVAPLVLWPPATGGVPDAACLTAAAIAGLAGLREQGDAAHAHEAGEQDADAAAAVGDAQ